MKRLGLLVLVLCIIGYACQPVVVHPKHPGPPPHAKAHGVMKKFYYYPNAEVYFNPATKVYIVYQNGAWLTVKECPGTIVSVSSYIIIHDETGNPWTKHSHYKHKHPPKHHKKPPKKSPKKKGPKKGHGKSKGKGKRK